MALPTLVTLIAQLPPHHPQLHAPTSLLHRIAKSNPAALSTERAASRWPLGLRVNPVDFGADPTGRKDSWAALHTSIGRCLNQSKLSPNGKFVTNTPQSTPLGDMGGCDVDLGGGEFLISKPLVLPEFVANMQFGRGSLVASANFKGSFLFVIGVEGSCKVPQGSCNLDINFPELFLDGAHVASGMQINNVMGVTIGPGGYFLNFTAFGLQINDGHEVMMQRCWLGETNFDFDHERFGMPPNATAIQINGNDHFMLDSIVFSSRVGLEVNGAADFISGVHVWFPVNHAVHFADTMAFHVTGSGNRFEGCYIDGGRAVFEPNSLTRNIWTNGFECCQRGEPAEGTTGSGILLVGSHIGPGLQIVNNEFGGGGIFHRISLWPPLGPPLGGVNAACKGTPSLNVSVADSDCQGLKRRDGPPSASATECEAACCADPACTVFQFCPAGGACTGATGSAAQCWTGQLSDCVSGGRSSWQGKGGHASPAPPVSIKGVRIAHNANSGGGQRGTQASMTLAQNSATKWSFDFCQLLVFAQIATVRVHVIAESGFPTAVARPPKGCKVMVETDAPVSGSITVDVDSAEPSSGFV